MKTRISKAQIEVWEWKETASKALSNILSKDIIGFISNEVSKLKSLILKSKIAKYPETKEDVNFVADK